MPLVSGDMCPIAIDIVDTFQVVDDTTPDEKGYRSIKELEEEQTRDKTKDREEEEKDDIEIPDSITDEYDYSHPIIEKGEHGYI